MVGGQLVVVLRWGEGGGRKINQDLHPCRMSEKERDTGIGGRIQRKEKLSARPKNQKMTPADGVAPHLMGYG